jgi:hypothetical protein
MFPHFCVFVDVRVGVCVVRLFIPLHRAVCLVFLVLRSCDSDASVLFAKRRKR